MTKSQITSKLEGKKGHQLIITACDLVRKEGAKLVIKNGYVCVLDQRLKFTEQQRWEWLRKPLDLASRWARVTTHKRQPLPLP